MVMLAVSLSLLSRAAHDAPPGHARLGLLEEVMLLAAGVGLGRCSPATPPTMSTCFRSAAADMTVVKDLLLQVHMRRDDVLSWCSYACMLLSA
jgi:hypothetical protein